MMINRILKTLIFALPALLSITFSSCSQATEVKVMSYNIRAGRGMDNNLDLERTAEVINRNMPDVVGLQEVDNSTNRSGKVDQAARLGELTGMHAVFAPAIEHDGGLYGVALLSREAPVSHKYIPLPGPEEVRALLMVEFKDYVIFNTHFSLREEARLQSADIINEAVKEYKKPVILMGDLNARPDSEVINKIEENWFPVSSHSIPTFPAGMPRQTIDFIFGYVGHGHGYEIISTSVIDEPEASDHRPVYSEIKLK